MSPTLKAVAVPVLDLKAQYQMIRDQIEPVVRDLFESQNFVMGPKVASLEAELAKLCGVAHGIGCASGTDALLLPLMAVDIGHGDEVITTPYSFFATAGSIWRTGAKPVFVDIESDSYNIDPAQIEAAITPRTPRSSRSTSTVRWPTWARSIKSPRSTISSSWKTRLKQSVPATMNIRREVSVMSGRSVSIRPRTWEALATAA